MFSLSSSHSEDSLPVPDFHTQSLSSIPSTVLQRSPSHRSQTTNQTHVAPVSLQHSSEALSPQAPLSPPVAKSPPPSRSTQASTPGGSDGHSASSSNFKVVIRVRPPLERELESGVPFRSILQLRSDHKACAVAEYVGAQIRQAERQKDIRRNPHALLFHQFHFDFIYDPAHDQNFLYENTARDAVLSVLEGYNATLLAYGQTGTGKTFTMEGFNSYAQKTAKIAQSPRRGIVPRAMEEIFKYIEKCRDSDRTFMVRASYLQIYNENVSDLLRPDRAALSIREDKKRGVFVEGLSEWAVRSPVQVIQLLAKGSNSRKTAATRMNDVSSRSHAVFLITIEQMIEGQVRVGKLNLVDLAGSERVRVTGATGLRLEQSKSINRSLSALGNVIAALTDFSSPGRHVPYRDSKLTRLLEDSLGGNCKTTMLAMVSPAPQALLETLSTLKFATRAKRVRNNARVNQDENDRALLKKYEAELRRLREELAEKNQQLQSSAHVLQLQEEKRRAEEDKENVIRELENRAVLYEKERAEKESLEEKIKLMNSQLLHGGQKIEDTPQFQSALQKQQQAIREEYERKIQDLEKERTSIQDSRAQVDKYKQLLLKQRDIMVAMTQRLNERDDTIVSLQEELDVFEKVNSRMSSSRVLQLERLLVKHNIEVPPENSLAQSEELLAAARVSLNGLRVSEADTVQGPKEVDASLLFEQAASTTPGKMQEKNVLGMLEGEAGGVLKNIINQVTQRGEEWKGVASELERAVGIVWECAEKLRGEAL